MYRNCSISARYLGNFQNLSNKKGLASYQKIPGPKGLPILGNLFDIKPYGEFEILSFRKFLAQIYDRYGDIVEWKIFNQKQIFLFNPEHVKEVFNSDGNTPIRSQLEPLVKLHEKINMSSALINSQGERWRKLRTLSNPIIARPLTIKSYLHNHNIIANELVQLIEKKMNANKTVTIHEFQIFLRMIALEYISEIIFDKRLKCLDEISSLNKNVTKLIKAIDEFSVYAGRLFFSPPFWKIYPTSDWKLFEQSGVIIYNQVRRYINEAYDYHLKSKKNLELEKKSVLGQYIENLTKYNMTIDDLIGIMAELLIGGIDTTSATLHYLLYEVCVNTDVQNKLYEEIKSVIKSNESVTEEHLEKLKYLKYVVKESMRLHSVAPTNSRIVTKDIKIENYIIPKGTQVFFSNAHTTRNEKYFRNPLKFDPSRWEKDESGEKPIHPYSSLPFGTGIRSCLGRRIAEQEIYLTLIKLVMNFKMCYVYKEEPGFKIALIALPVMPLGIQFTKR